MREKYIVCNKCGEKIAERDLPKKDYLQVTKKWGYFSNKDLSVHRFVICESCYDEFVKGFKIKPETGINKKAII